MSTIDSGETRPGLPLPERERDAVAKIIGMMGVGTGNVDGESNGTAVVRYVRGYPEAHMWHGLLVPQFVDGYQRLVHAWAIETADTGHGPARPYTGTSVLHRYRDGDIRVVTVPTEPNGTGVRGDQLAAAHHAIRDFADLAPTDPKPTHTDEDAYRTVEYLPNDVLRAAARWMLDDAAVTTFPAAAAA